MIKHRPHDERALFPSLFLPPNCIAVLHATSDLMYIVVAAADGTLLACDTPFNETDSGCASR